MKVGDWVRHEVTGRELYDTADDWTVVVGDDGWARSMRRRDLVRSGDRLWIHGRVVVVAEHTVSFETFDSPKAVYTCRTEKAELVGSSA